MKGFKYQNIFPCRIVTWKTEWDRNFLSHWVQLYRFSPVWRVIWDSRLAFLVKPFPQKVHRNVSFTSMCLLTCVWDWKFRLCLQFIHLMISQRWGCEVGGIASVTLRKKDDESLFNSQGLPCSSLSRCVASSADQGYFASSTSFHRCCRQSSSPLCAWSCVSPRRACQNISCRIWDNSQPYPLPFQTQVHDQPGKVLK